MNTVLTVWSIFAGDRPTLCSYAEQLHDWCYSEKQIAFQVLSCDDALARETGNREYPDLILINSSRRGEFSRKMLRRIVGGYPLSLLLEITGEWCIGDTRSGDPLPIGCRFDVTLAHQRLQSMLSSRQHFIQVRAALNPLARFAELFSFRNRNNLAATGNDINVIASSRSERQALQILLQQEGCNVRLHPNWKSIPLGNRYLPNIFCVADRRELEGVFEETSFSPSVIIASHFNGLDKACFEGKSSVTFLRKPFLGHDLVNAISSVCLLANADAA